jgi:5-methylcytosine-specific restriction endonuclease McrA
MGCLAFNHDVLILNKNYRAINIQPLYKAVGLLFAEEKPLVDRRGNVLRQTEPKARVYDPSQDFALFTWESWSKLKPRKVPCCMNPLCGQFERKLAVGDPEVECVECHSYLEDVDEDCITHAIRKDGDVVVEKIRLPSIILLSRYTGYRMPRTNFNRRSIYQRDENTCQYCGKEFPSSELNLDHVIPKCQGGKATWENIVLSCVKCNSKKAGRTPQQAGMKLLHPPSKPALTALKGRRRVIPKDWDQFISECYWETELVNDNK